MATQSQVAEHLFMTQPNVSQLTSDGVLTRGATGYDIDACRKAYITHLREVAAGRRAANGEDLDLVAERALLTKEQRISQAMKNEALRGSLLQREAVTAAVQSAFVRVRSRLLAIPSKAAPLVYQAPAIAEVEARLTDTIHEALAELATTQVVSDSADVGLLEGDGPADGAGGAGLVDGAKAAAEADGQPVGGSKPVSKRRGQRRAG